MTVKEIFKPIMLNDNVSIIDQKIIIIIGRVKEKNIPLRYCDYEVKHIYSEPLDNGDSKIVIAIIV